MTTIKKCGEKTQLKSLIGFLSANKMTTTVEEEKKEKKRRKINPKEFTEQDKK